MCNDTRSGKWDYAHSVPINRLSKQTVGIVGYGRIGRCFASLVRPLVRRIVTYDPFFTVSGQEDVEFVDFQTLLQVSDVISIHCNLETAKSMFDLSAMKQMKSTAL